MKARGIPNGRILLAAWTSVSESAASARPPGSRGTGFAAIWRRARWTAVVLCTVAAIVGETPHPGATAPASWGRQDDTSAAVPLTFAPDADAQVVETEPTANFGNATQL